MNGKITELDRPIVKHIRSRLEAVFKPLAEELGLAIEVGSCTFNASNCRLQLKVSVLDGDGKAMTEESESFRSNAKLFGLEPDDLGKEFTFRGQLYAICGLKPKSRKYPVIARTDNGKNYKFPCRTVLEALGRQVPDWL